MKKTELTKQLYKKRLIPKRIDDILKEEAKRLGIQAARLKELEIIYPSLVAIAQGQKEIKLEVPNGRWVFKSYEN